MTVNEDLKRCSKCSNSLCVTSFSPIKRNQLGEILYRSSWCNSCRAENNRERLGLVERKIPEVFSDSKECLRCNQVKLFNHFSPAKRGRCGLSSYCNDCSTRATKEKSRINTKKYREVNRARYLAAHRLVQFNRKNILKAKTDNTITDNFIKFLYNQEYCCWCKKFVEKDKRTLEHIVELSNGGLHSIHNINMSCISCNSARLNKNSDHNIESLFEKFKKEEE